MHSISQNSCPLECFYSFKGIFLDFFLFLGIFWDILGFFPKKCSGFFQSHLPVVFGESRLTKKHKHILDSSIWMCFVVSLDWSEPFFILELRKKNCIKNDSFRFTFNWKTTKNIFSFHCNSIARRLFVSQLFWIIDFQFAVCVFYGEENVENCNNYSRLKQNCEFDHIFWSRNE